MRLNKSNSKKWLITGLRMAIGWHFLYEGFVKLVAGDWSAYSYLINTSGPFSGFYHGLASSPAVVSVVDFLNIWGLIGAGLALFMGIFIRWAAAGGIVLLLLYYFAYPPFGASMLNNAAGQFYLIDRNLIEALTLLVLLVIREKGYGVGALIPFPGKIKQTPELQVTHTDEPLHARREVLKNLVSLPVLGVMGWGASQMTRKFGVDTLSGATIQLKTSDLRKLAGDLPRGKIGAHEISRLVMGGNLIGGWAHSRDLLYVPSLFRAYNTEKKVFETLMLAEKAGINTINIGYPSNALIAKYKKLTGSSLKVISQVAPNMDKGDYFEQINGAIDAGADILQVQGNWCDWLVRDGKPEVIAAMLEKIRSQGFTAGLGAHTVDSLIACEELGILPDYYMQTMHHDNYWSAHPRENRVPFEVDGKKNPEHDRFHDNCFCLFPDRTVEFVNRVKIPVMGFKVLAAGAITPEDGFKWAFENGADFVCVGMFDFQVVDDVNVTMATLKNLPDRKRAWFA